MHVGLYDASVKLDRRMSSTKLEVEDSAWESIEPSY